MKFTILYDNTSYKPGWEKGWGFSCLIQSKGASILFDTGENGEKLLKNFELSASDPAKIDYMTFSHSDWDHIDGTRDFLSANKHAHVFIPYCFSDTFRNLVEEYGHEYTITGYEMTQLIPDVFSTPLYINDTGPHEAGIMIRAAEYDILLTGCAHPGILQMTRDIRKLDGQKPIAVIGGFHLKSRSVEYIETLIDDLIKEGVELFAPAHCTGEEQIEVFSRKCCEQFIRLGSGRSIEFK